MLTIWLYLANLFLYQTYDENLLAYLYGRAVITYIHFPYSCFASNVMYEQQMH